jgi:hypothetical protein
LGFCALAFVLYWQALFVGLLSDDYVLVARASQWAIGPVTPALFRPLPLFLWAVLLHSGGGPFALHCMNILLHGTNAYLMARVIGSWLGDWKWTLLAGLLVLTSPLAPEGVVWCSGVFDVLATTLVLGCLLLARRYRERVSPSTRIQFFACGVAAAACKETAVVGVGLLLADAWARRAQSRLLLIDTGVLAGILGAYSVVRAVYAFGLKTPAFSKYLLQRAVFGSFGGLAVPWHMNVIHWLPWVPITGVLGLTFVLSVFFLESGSIDQTRQVIAAAVWVLLPMIPIFPIVFIAPDLQASRYLYLSAPGWAALLVSMSAAIKTRYLTSLALFSMLAIIAVASYGTRLHLQPWQDAARLRDRVEAAVDQELHGCDVFVLSDLPDSVAGAYVFRNGGAEAFERDLHRHTRLGRSDGPCAFQWQERSQSFVPSHP